VPDIIPLSSDAAKPITQEQAAALTGVTLRHLQRICVGPDAPPKLANAVGRAHGFPCIPFGAWLRARIKSDLGVSDNGEVIDPQREKALLDRARRITVETEHQTRIGELLEARVVAETWAAQVGIAKGRILSLPARIAPQVIGIGDLRAIEGVIRDAIHEALTELSEEK
jgi:hypothetical protein